MNAQISQDAAATAVASTAAEHPSAWVLLRSGRRLVDRRRLDGGGRRNGQKRERRIDPRRPGSGSAR